MVVGEMAVSEMAVSEMAVGEMAVGEMAVGEMAVDESPLHLKWSDELKNENTKFLLQLLFIKPTDGE